jgi:uncharacterized paraquat-inducible protein A
MKHLAIKSAVWLALLTIAFVVLQVSVTAFVVLSGLTSGFLFAQAADAVAGKFAPEQEPCDDCPYTASYCNECRTVQREPVTR